MANQLHQSTFVGHRAKVLADSIIQFVESLIALYSVTLVEMAVRGKRRETVNRRHRDNFLGEIDLELHDRYYKHISTILPSFVFVSEEAEPQVHPANYIGMPEYVVIVDPLDTSELAVRGLHGHTHIAVFSTKEQRPMVAVVGDMFHSVQIYCAYWNEGGSDKAFLKTREGVIFDIVSSGKTVLHQALVTNYFMRPRERFERIASEKGLLRALSREDEAGNRQGRIGLDFGSIALCHVAAGFTDAVIEVADGFFVWDLYPGHYILQAAGGIVASLDGELLSLKLSLENLEDLQKAMSRRRKFVAAGNRILLDRILDSLARGT